MLKLSTELILAMRTNYYRSQCGVERSWKKSTDGVANARIHQHFGGAVRCQPQKHNIQLKLFAIFMDYSNKIHCGVTQIKCVCVFVAMCLVLTAVVYGGIIIKTHDLMYSSQYWAVRKKLYFFLLFCLSRKEIL